jgi:hypothetical protein
VSGRPEPTVEEQAHVASLEAKQGLAAGRGARERAHEQNEAEALGVDHARTPFVLALPCHVWW